MWCSRKDGWHLSHFSVITSLTKNAHGAIEHPATGATVRLVHLGDHGERKSVYDSEREEGKPPERNE